MSQEALTLNSEEPQQLTETCLRNSELRTVVDPVLATIVRRLQERLPDLTPDHITGLGLVLVVISEGLSVSEEKSLRRLGLFMYLVGQFCDKLDGVWAREMIASGYDHDSRRGALVDAVADRLVELFTSLGQMARASGQDDELGVLMALASALTNNTSSLTRAYAEANGKSVPEAGSGLFGFLGTRAGRAVLGFVVRLAPESKVPLTDISLPAVLAGLSALTTLLTAYERVCVACDKQILPILTQKEKDQARTRFVLMAITSSVAVIASLLLFSRLKRSAKD
ncbi:MAG: hypothetical protein GF381_04165 [Candidatus Pacebacteria bacterium]|nr:hypothetical protein [Candidatus Paceibacterota bacterium]